MFNPVETLLSLFFPSDLLPWFDEGTTGWDTICLGFDKSLEDAVSGWDRYGFEDYPIWLNPELGAALSHDRLTGHLVLSIHPSRRDLEGELAFLLSCGAGRL
jgi:hypothetical protein